MTPKPPRLRHALRLRCPHCGETPLLQTGSWLTFRHGCEPCGYVFEREEGYFTGASWVVNYLVSGVSGAAVAAVLLWRAPAVALEAVIGVAAAVGIGIAVAFFPVAKAIWLWADHVLHPL